MKLAVDVYYSNSKAKIVGILFNEWNDEKPTEILSTYTDDVLDYESGSFYKRELPCILKLLKKIDISTIELIIIDGYVFLNNEGKKGLGFYLYEQLNMQIPIIGVAKKSFYNNNAAVKICRGNSSNPLYVTSVGIDLDIASEYIKTMSGKHRFPLMLKLLDEQTKIEKSVYLS